MACVPPLVYLCLDIFYDPTLWPDCWKPIENYEFCEQPRPDSFLQTRWNSYSCIVYFEAGALILLQWFHSQSPPLRFLPFGTALSLLTLGVLSINCNGSLTIQAQILERFAEANLLFNPAV